MVQGKNYKYAVVETSTNFIIVRNLYTTNGYSYFQLRALYQPSGKRFHEEKVAAVLLFNRFTLIFVSAAPDINQEVLAAVSWLNNHLQATFNFL